MGFAQGFAYCELMRLSRQTWHLEQARGTSRTPARSQTPPSWPLWFTLVAFAFIAFESTLLAAAMKGPWLILLAPGAVCAVKAVDTWRELRRRMESLNDS